MAKTTVKQNFVLNIIKTIVGVLYPIIAFKYVSNVLGVDNVGRVQFMQSVISYFSLLAGLGIASYAVREGGKIRNNRFELTKLFKELFRINIVTMLITMGLLILCIFLGIFKKDIVLLLICSLTIVFSTLSVEWINQVCEDYLYISIRTIIFQIISLIAIFLFVREKGDFLIYAFLICFGNGGYFLFNLFHLPKYIDVHQKMPLEYKKHLKPIFVIFGLSVSTSIYVNLDTVILGYMKGDYDVGLYSAATKILVAIKAFSTAITAVVMPRLSEYANENKKKDVFDKLIKYAFDLNMLFIIPIICGLLCLSGPLILLLSGPDFLPAVTASQLLAINLFFAIINGIVCFQILLPFGEEKYAAFSTAMGAVSNLILNFLLIPNYGINGAAFATVLSEGVVFIIMLLRAREYIELKFLFKDLIKFAIGGLIIFPVSLIISKVFASSFILVLFISIVICAILYFIILIKIKTPIMLDIKNDIVKMIKK